jgi:hypothetical protein
MDRQKIQAKMSKVKGTASNHCSIAPRSLLSSSQRRKDSADSIEPPAGNDSLHADVFIQEFPVNPLSAADQSKLLPLLHRCPEEARIPNQRNRDASAVGQVHNQSFVSELRSDGPQRRFINYQTSHPALSGTFVHFLRSAKAEMSGSSDLAKLGFLPACYFLT